MRITNTRSIHPALLARIRDQQGEYKREAGGVTPDFTVTELIQGPRLAILKRTHEYAVEAHDLIKSWIGSLIHNDLAKYGEGALVEERMIRKLGVWTIAGSPDRYEPGADFDLLSCNGGVLVDWKYTSTYAWTYSDKSLRDWTPQLNCYAWILRGQGISPRALQIQAIFNDWKLSESKRNPAYPPRQQEFFPIELWSDNKVEDWITSRIERFQKGDACNAAERWEKPARWALQREGAKRAISLHDTQAEAQEGRDKQKNQTGLFIDRRFGERTRCEHYCPVNMHCPEFQSYKKELGEI